MIFLAKENERDLEKGLANPFNSSPNLLAEVSSSSSLPFPSPTPSPSATPRATLVFTNSGKKLLVSNSSKSLVVSNSGKRFDRKKYLRQVTGRHNDTELHLAAQRDDLEAVKRILGEIDEQMIGTSSGADFDAEVAEIRSAVVNEVNELGDTALSTAAERGHLEVVKELLKYTTKDAISHKNRSGLNPLHLAASNGHQAYCFILNLSRLKIQILDKSHAPIVFLVISVAVYCHSGGMLQAARQGHVEVVKALLDKDPQLARRIDKKGQTALHMAVKGVSGEVVVLLLEADPAIVMLPDKFGNTALHVATRKKRAQIVNTLLRLPETNVNALTRDRKTALDIAEALIFTEETSEIRECLAHYGGVRASELNQPRDELRNTVTQIKKDVHFQLEQTRKTNKNVSGIANDLRRLHREGINNATNSVTVVAVLFATVAFAAIFTVPGGAKENGTAVVSRRVRKVRKKEKSSRRSTVNSSWHYSETDSEVKPIYAI
ncbi:CASKIN [Salix viminalis]|uniref:CASKIN n=1 Tax=Salix viminalis TaxID=40686 RepID=A0A9Q0V6X7_SALVM|nr:CASKIN [Salix viminalis]